MLNDKGEEVGIIYGWYNMKSGKWYIGQTVNQERRFKDHIDAAINKKDNTKFHNALRKYGLENFVYCVLESNVLRENLNLKEQEWIEYYDSFYNGYNLTAGGSQTIFSEETRQKLSDKLKGKHLSEETRKKLSESHMGKKMSEEARKRMSDSRKGLIPWNKGKTTWNTGKHGIYSEETRKRMSESHKGKPSNKRKKVSKYDLTGNYIQTYNSITDAVKENPKCTSIIGVCKGKFKQSGGFIWKYAS